MSFLISLALPIIICLVLAGASTLWWLKVLPSPLLFAVTALLATLGLHRLIQAATEFAKLFVGGGYFLEARQQPIFAQLASESLNTELLVVCVALVALSVPLLSMLRTAMARA
jgi:hypothetical protein